jgi:protein-S-isoprenylcysteine O-methyltransferase Ste14
VSAIPAFEIGVWNAWIFMLYYFLPTPILMLVWLKRTRGEAKVHNETEKKVRPVMVIIWLAASVYSIFLPIRLGTMWFYVGLPISLIGTIGYTAVIPSLITTPIDKEPLAKGLYRYSRHPMYISQLVMYIGVGIACASWVFLLFSIVYTILCFVCAISEERYCLEKYGDAYREYMNKTPRWIGIPKS